MSALREKEIARRLASLEAPEPPPELLAKLQEEIPADLDPISLVEPVGPDDGFPANRARMWLVAASLAITVAGGFLALQVQRQSLSPGEGPTSREAPTPAAAPAPAPAPALAPKLEASADLAPAPAVPPESLPEAAETLRSRSRPVDFAEAEVLKTEPAVPLAEDDSATELVAARGALADQPLQRSRSSAEVVEEARKEMALDEEEGRIFERREELRRLSPSSPSPPPPAPKPPPPSRGSSAPGPSEDLESSKEPPREARSLSRQESQELRKRSPRLSAAAMQDTDVARSLDDEGLERETPPLNSFLEAQQAVKEGRLPEPKSIRIEEWVGYFSRTQEAKLRRQVSLEEQAATSGEADSASRLAVLASEAAEAIQKERGARGKPLEEVARLARELARELSGEPKAAELASFLEEALRLHQEGASPGSS